MPCWMCLSRLPMVFTTLRRNIGILENNGIEGELFVKMVDRLNGECPED